jgi:hypothetical protein
MTTADLEILDEIEACLAGISAHCDSISGILDEAGAWSAGLEDGLSRIGSGTEACLDALRGAR